MLCAVKIIDRHLGEQKLLEMAAFLYAGRFDAYKSPLKSLISEGFFLFFVYCGAGVDDFQLILTYAL